jgi:hypothetical protein
MVRAQGLERAAHSGPRRDQSLAATAWITVLSQRRAARSVHRLRAVARIIVDASDIHLTSLAPALRVKALIQINVAEQSLRLEAS